MAAASPRWWSAGRSGPAARQETAGPAEAAAAAACRNSDGGGPRCRRSRRSGRGGWERRRRQVERRIARQATRGQGLRIDLVDPLRALGEHGWNRVSVGSRQREAADNLIVGAVPGNESPARRAAGVESL